MPKTKEKLSAPISNFRLSETALQQLDECTPQHLPFRSRIELAINMAWTLYKNQEKFHKAK